VVEVASRGFEWEDGAEAGSELASSSPDSTVEWTRGCGGTNLDTGFVLWIPGPPSCGWVVGREPHAVAASPAVCVDASSGKLVLLGRLVAATNAGASRTGEVASEEARSCASSFDHVATREHSSSKARKRAVECAFSDVSWGACVANVVAVGSTLACALAFNDGRAPPFSPVAYVWKGGDANAVVGDDSAIGGDVMTTKAFIPVGVGAWQIHTVARFAATSHLTLSTWVLS
jgi:hypothetical protein